MNWKELKEFCNNLSESDLEKKVILWREEDVIADINVMSLEEDHYIGDESSDHCIPESEAKSIADDPDEFPNGIEDMIKVYDKGHPILWEVF